MASKNIMENIVERLDDRAQQITNRAMLAGPSLLTYPEKVDSSRLIMFNSHQNQRVVLNTTELPKVFTNYENIVGENSSYNVRAKSNLKIIKIIHKFNALEESRDIQQAFIFVYDMDNDCYDMIIRNDVEDLTEKYGFQFDCTEINKYKEGDYVEKGATLFRPTSYDEFGNYGFGRNVKAMYLSCDETIEDAIWVSESLSKIMESSEIETVRVPINDNDILLNLFGDEEHYKAFPNIGEKTKNKILCAKRRLNKAQILFDLKSSNMSRILNSDIRTFSEGEVVDIDIYCNVPLEDIPRTDFNEQLIQYIEMTHEFYTQVKEVTRELLDSGIPCSQSIHSWNKRATELTDPDYKIKDEFNSEFGYIVMSFTIKRTVGLFRGQKVTGRLIYLIMPVSYSNIRERTH